MAEISTKLSSSLALRKLGGENPFAIETVRERTLLPATIPEVDSGSLSKRERKIYLRAREDTLAIGLTAIKGEVAVAATEELEDFAQALFARTTTRIEHRMRFAQAASDDEEYRALQRVFAVESVKRMGAAMVAMADATERGMQAIVERELSVEEQPSLLRLVFAGRRR